MNILQFLLGILFIFPVGLAHQFSVDKNITHLILMLISVLLLTYSLTALTSKIKVRNLKLLASLIIFPLVAIYFFSHLLSYYFQGEGFNAQFLFHFNLNTLWETWHTYSTITAVFLVWFACIVFAVVFIRQKRSNTKNKILLPMLLAALLINPEFLRVGKEVLIDQQEANSIVLDTLDWNRLGLNSAALDTDITATPGKNLVLIYLEGLENIYTEESIFPGLTPNINALAKSGLRHRNMQQVNGSGWTIGGLVASMCGTPAVHDFGLGGNNIMFTSFLQNANCLSDVLAHAGYEQIFMGGASTRFAGKGNFLRTHQYDRVEGRGTLLQHLKNPEYINAWGLYDDSLFELATEEYVRLADQGTPFNLTILTVDTHHPDGDPSDSCPAYQHRENNILNAVHCSDFLLGNFIEQISQHPGFADTVIVVTSDHLSMRNTAHAFFPRNYSRNLLFFALNGDVYGELQKTATPMDIAPTVLGLLDVEHTTSFLAGSNFMAQNFVDHGVNLHSRARLNSLRFINSRYLSNEPKNVYFSLEKHSINRLNFANDITEVRHSNQGLTMLATGNDPYFILPELPESKATQVQIFVAIHAAEPTQTALYFAESTQEDFAEEKVMVRELHEGRNELLFVLEDENFGRRLRIDPIAIEGEIHIESLTVTTN